MKLSNKTLFHHRSLIAFADYIVLTIKSDLVRFDYIYILMYIFQKLKLA